MYLPPSVILHNGSHVSPCISSLPPSPSPFMESINTRMHVPFSLRICAVSLRV